MLSLENIYVQVFLIFSVTADHLFAENKEKQINAALMALITKDIPPDDLQGMYFILFDSFLSHLFIFDPIWSGLSLFDPVLFQGMEQQFHALRRLVASKAGFAGFTNLPGFREKIGVKVNKALKLG